MKRLLLALMLAVCSVTPLAAQPSQAQYDSLLKHLALIDSILGTKGFLGPQIACRDMEAHRPTWYFPNGEYPIDYRQKQLGCGTNDLATHVNVSDIAIVSFAAKMPPSNRTVPEYVNSAIAAIPASSTANTTGTVQIPNLGNGIIMKDVNGPSHLLFAGGGDRGLRLLYNFTPSWQANTYSDPTLMQTRLDFEQDGVISMNYFKPWNAAAGPYDTLSGKALAFRVGGCGPQRCGSARGEFADIYGGLVGRGLRLGVSDTNANWPTWWGLQIKGDKSANPVSVFINGSLQQLKSCNIGGVTVVCL